MFIFDFCLQVANEQHEVEIRQKNEELRQKNVQFEQSQVLKYTKPSVLDKTCSVYFTTPRPCIP